MSAETRETLYALAVFAVLWAGSVLTVYFTNG